ncbi:MAG: hypothetical protein ACQUYJ_03065 [Ferruginibacter sp.]
MMERINYSSLNGAKLKLLINASKKEFISDSIINSRKRKKTTSGIMLYDYYINEFKKRKEISVSDFLFATAVSYSWMPTMLDVYVDKIPDINKAVFELKALGRLNTFKKLNDCIDSIDKIEALSRIINNSVVGASKVMHLFHPDHIPIIDSRVIKSWNQFFSDDKNFKITNSSKGYLKYWKCLLVWKENLNKNGNKKYSVRSIEKIFFDYGK